LLGELNIQGNHRGGLKLNHKGPLAYAQWLSLGNNRVSMIERIVRVDVSVAQKRHACFLDRGTT
jgi:hypothetical protein